MMGCALVCVCGFAKGENALTGWAAERLHVVVGENDALVCEGGEVWRTDDALHWTLE